MSIIIACIALHCFWELVSYNIACACTSLPLPNCTHCLLLEVGLTSFPTYDRAHTHFPFQNKRYGLHVFIRRLRGAQEDDASANEVTCKTTNIIQYKYNTTINEENVLHAHQSNQRDRGGGREADGEGQQRWSVVRASARAGGSSGGGAAKGEREHKSYDAAGAIDYDVDKISSVAVVACRH
jgi:hypothetical protein